MASNKRMMSPNRTKIIIRDNGTCQVCKKRWPEITPMVAHRVLPKDGGKFTWGNMYTLCHDCCTKKGQANESQTPSPI